MRHIRVFLAVISTLLFVESARAQTFPAPDYLRQMIYRPQIPSQLPGPEGLRDYVVDGKLRLSLADAIRLTLLNNTNVRMNRLQVDDAKFNLVRSYAPFDPVAMPRFQAGRSYLPSVTQLAGAPTLSTLNQQATFDYTQTFQSGTSYDFNVSSARSNTNSLFYFVNPSIASSVGLTVTQPLLRNRGYYVNRAPIMIARRNVHQSEAGFEAEVNDTLLNAVQTYWTVVQAREQLNIARESLAMAEASYKRDKRALELGALGPLDIYRSESEVASRRVSVIQADYGLKQAEDALRQTVGADLDPYIRPLDLDLVEKPEPSGELYSTDIGQALQRALAQRPELAALRDRLANAETSIRISHNELLPDLRLSAFYSASGVGGNQFDTSTTPPTLIAATGLGRSFTQIRGFDFPSYGFTLSLNLPVRNHGAQADLGNAMVARRRALYATRQQQEAIQLQVSNSVHQLEQAKLSMAAAKIARDLAQKNLEAEQRKYELGAETIFFVLEAQTELAQAQTSLMQAEIGYQLSVNAVLHDMGGLLDHYKVQIAKQP